MPQQGYFAPYGIPTLAEGPAGEYLTDRLNNEAIELIVQHRASNPEAPFFLNYCPYAVHAPIQAPPELIAKYEKKAAALGLDAVDPIITGEHFSCVHKRDQRIERRIIQSDPAYAAMIENLDTNIGALGASLQAQGIFEDTLIIFTSDNGGLATAEGSPTCNLPLAEGKGWHHEGGNRVSQIAHWPSVIPAGRVCHDNMTSPDLYPTLLAAAGLPLIPEQHCDGVNLLPVLAGSDPQALNSRTGLFWHYPHYSNQGDTPGAVVLCGDWKLVWRFEDDACELYYLPDDPSETRNCLDDEPKRGQHMLAMLKEWQCEVGALQPEPNPNWQPEQPRVANNAHI